MQRNESFPSDRLPSFMIEVMAFGAKGAHCCQALNRRTALALVSLHVTPNTRTSVKGCTRNENSVAIPNEPPPPPRHAQNKSGSCCGSAASTWLSAFTILTQRRLSQVSP